MPQVAQRVFTKDERDAAADEESHRSFMGTHFPPAARAAGYEVRRWDPSARGGSPLLGVTEAG